MPGEVSPGTLQALQGVVKKRREEVFIVRKIGEGAFGEVSQAHVFPYGSVAVKWLKVCGRVWVGGWGAGGG